MSQHIHFPRICPVLRAMPANAAVAISRLALCAVLANAAVAAAEDHSKRIDMSAACTLIGGKLTSVGVEECLERGLAETGAYTTEGRPILYKKYPPLSGKQPNARILLIGGTHGDEYASFSVVFKWMKILDQHHSGLFHWHVVPALNLDGLLKSPAIRMNHNGVDLNRNLDTGDWYSALLYWEQETRKNPRRYPGSAAASESETRWLAEEIKNFKPDVIVSVHSPYGLVDYDGPSHIKPPASLGALKLGDLGTFPGSLGRYAGEKFSIPVLTIELASSRYMPAASEVRNIWVELVHWLRYNVTRRCEPPHCNEGAREH